jgi:hypothetical protein
LVNRNWTKTLPISYLFHKDPTRPLWVGYCFNEETHILEDVSCQKKIQLLNIKIFEDVLVFFWLHNLFLDSISNPILPPLLALI